MSANPLLHLVSEVIRRVASYGLNLYVMTALAIIHVALVGVSVDQVVGPALDRVGLGGDQVSRASQDFTMTIDDIKSGRVPARSMPFDGSKDSRRGDFDPLNWDQLRLLLSEAETQTRV